MRILHITPRYLPAHGGAEELLSQLSSRLAADGHLITVATTDASSADLLWNPAGQRLATQQEMLSGVQVLRFPVRHLPAAPPSYSAMRRVLWLLSRIRSVPIQHLNSLARYTPWVPELSAWLGRTAEPYDLVMAMNICFESLIEAAATFAARRHIPFVCFPLTHLGAGAVPGADGLSSFYTMRHQIDLVRRGAALLTMTPTESLFYTANGIEKRKITVIGSAVDPIVLAGGDGTRFREHHHLPGPIVYMLGTLCYDKGTIHTIEAMRSIWRSGGNACLVLAGTMLSDVKYALSRLSRAQREQVIVLGSISEQEKKDLLAAGDLLVMPSRTESFGTVYLEAWHYARPVIGSRTWGVQDVVTDGLDGYLVPFGDVSQLAARIAALVSDQALAHRLGAQGQMTAQKYTWDTRYPLLRDVYLELCDQGVRDAPRS